MSRVGSRLIQAAQEAAAMARGETVPGAVLHMPPDVRAIRGRLKLTQPAFARRFGLPVGTVRDWEQGRAVPDQAARVLLRIIEREPEAVQRAVAG
ncbi:helix-turn-helix domain-containing protein [Roseococcus thiosulfatophilus]|jgi:putative transcriptional regulator|uniref:helix-turn-helix domain-containing protein n=1 Tax=Roseococcus thiosulfatophilus TaxID=35813 RepID=UPI001A8EC53B|nr:helix-turn-helix domain-containing protein [Roseococcus thiosulfatophilus]